MPSIIEAWLSSSEKTIRPGRIFASVASVASLETKPEVNSSARFLAVQIGKLGFQLDMIMRGAGDVARAAGARAGRVDGLVHGGEHLGMLAHAEIVVAAPHRDGPPGAFGMEIRVRVGAALAHDIGEDAIAAFAAQARERIPEPGQIGKAICQNRPLAPRI